MALHRFYLAAVIATVSCTGTGTPPPTPNPAALPPWAWTARTPPPPDPATLPASASAEYRIYAAILTDFASRPDFYSRRPPSCLLVRDTAFEFIRPGSPKPWVRTGVQLSGNNLVAPIPVVLLGDSIERHRNWGSVYNNRDGASDVLRLFRPVFDADSSAATAWIQNRCAPAMCGGIDELRLERRNDGAWAIVASRHVLGY